jgi:hypothetical protein
MVKCNVFLFDTRSSGGIADEIEKFVEIQLEGLLAEERHEVGEGWSLGRFVGDNDVRPAGSASFKLETRPLALE